MRYIILSLLLTTQIFAFSLSLKDKDGNLKPSAQTFVDLFDLPGEIKDKGVSQFIKDKWLQSENERWQLKELFNEKLEDALPLLEKLNCINTIYAKSDHYDYALVLGALRSHMQKRLDFLYEEWKRGVNFDQVVLLTGRRDLDPNRETIPLGLKTETELFIHLYENHPLSEIAPMSVIDSVKIRGKNGILKRPNTAATIRDWIDTNPKKGKVLAVSTQPFVGYQHSVLSYYLGKGFPLETIGPKTDIFSMATYLDTFAKWLYYEEMEKEN